VLLVLYFVFKICYIFFESVLSLSQLFLLSGETINDLSVLFVLLGQHLNLFVVVFDLSFMLSNSVIKL